jgi:hypothetical protein
MKKLLIILALMMPMLSSAHGQGGTVEKVVGDYFVDAGWSEPILRAGKSSRFDFLLLKSTDRSDADFNQVFVKITKNNSLAFVATLPRPSFGTAGMTYTFHEAGDYKFEITYLKDQQTVVATDFTTNVQGGEVESSGFSGFLRVPIVSFCLGLFAGLLIQFIVGKMK